MESAKNKAEKRQDYIYTQNQVSMKLLTLCIFLSIAILGIAQEKIQVSVEQKEMSQGTQTAFRVTIPETTPKLVEKEWKKYINERSLFEFATKGTSQSVEKAFMGVSNIFSKDKKSYSKHSLKVEKVGNELVVKNILNEEVINHRMDVIASISVVDEGVCLSSFFKYSDSTFISESNVNEDILSTLKNYIREFGIETYEDIVQEQVDVELALLKEQEGILVRLERENESLHKSIGSDDADIEEFQYNINSLVKDLERIEESISKIKVSLNEVERKSVEYDSIKEDLKFKEKERDKNLKKQKSYKNKIKRNQTNIQKENSDILENQKEQELQKEVISKQKLRVDEFNNKLISVR